MSIHSRLRNLNEKYLPGRLFLPPEWIVLGVNNFCNLHCLMCDVGTANDETNFGANLVGADTRSMSIELFARILDQRAQFAPDAKIGFAFTEPLAWRPIVEAVRMAKSAGAYVAVTSNGLMLPRHADDLAKSGLDHLAISLDGPEKTHNLIRRKKDSHQRAVEGIKKFRETNQKTRIQIPCTITEWNVGQLVEHAREMSAIGVDDFVVMHNCFVTEDMAALHNQAHPTILATRSNDFMSDITKIDLDLLAAQLEELRQLDLPMQIVIQPDLSSRADLDLWYKDHDKFIGRRCTDVQRLLMIDSDGEAIPAHGRCFRFPIGNIKDQTLAELWNAPSLSELRRGLKQAGGFMEACSRCCGATGI